MDKRDAAALRRRLKGALSTTLTDLGFSGQWPEWSRRTAAQQHFIMILAWKYGGGYQVSAGYTGRGPHVAAYPFVKDELWETIAEDDVRFSHTLPDCRRHLNATASTSGFPLPDDADEIDGWIETLLERIKDLDRWLNTGKESLLLSPDGMT